MISLLPGEAATYWGLTQILESRQARYTNTGRGHTPTDISWALMETTRRMYRQRRLGPQRCKPDSRRTGKTVRMRIQTVKKNGADLGINPEKLIGNICYPGLNRTLMSSAGVHSLGPTAELFTQLLTSHIRETNNKVGTWCIDGARCTTINLRLSNSGQELGK